MDEKKHKEKDTPAKTNTGYDLKSELENNQPETKRVPGKLWVVFIFKVIIFTSFQ